MENNKKVAKGDRIKIVNPEYTFGDYEKGDIMTVKSVEPQWVRVEDYSNDPSATDLIFHEEYEIIEKFVQNG